MNEGLSPETLAAQSLTELDAESGALVPPIHASTIYERKMDGAYRSGSVYTRADSPTFDHTEHLLAALEGAAGYALFLRAEDRVAAEGDDAAFHHSFRNFATSSKNCMRGFSKSTKCVAFGITTLFFTGACVR